MTRLAACVLAATVAAALACSSKPNAIVAQKLVILGFDGMDPGVVERLIEEGKLPAFARLAARSGLHRLETTHSVNTATAWASFATGVNAGKHRIFDVVSRDAHTYAPELAMLRQSPARVLFDYMPIAPPRTTSTRAATSFWVTAGRAGVRSTILGVPMTFPPEDVPNGQLLAGFPLPDAAGTTGTYHYFSTDVRPSEEGRTELGGVVRRLTFQARRADAELVGARDPFAGAERQGASVRQPFALTWNHEDRSATLEIGGQTIHLLERQWTRWIDVSFDTNLLTTVRGVVRFFLASAGQHLRLYASPVHWNPAAPPEPMSAPSGFAKDVYDRVGMYRTLGWPGSAFAISEGRLDEAAFIEDLERDFADRAETILNRVDAKDWDLLVGVIDATDRVQHVMWRLRDPAHPRYDPELARVHGSAIERIYRRSDEFVAEVVRRLEPNTALMIVSAHGFRSYRSTVNLNSWLVEKGYMSLRAPVAPKRTLNELSRPGNFWEHVDWSKTRAYSVGFGQVFVNLKGREAQGVVSEAEYEQLLDMLLIDLMTWHDERTYDRVVANVHKRSEIYAGPYVHDAADLAVSLEPNFGIWWQTALGGTPPRSIEANLSKWSGDHAGADHRMIPGLFMANQPIAREPRVIDIAPTVLKFFGLAVPQDLDGEPLY